MADLYIAFYGALLLKLNEEITIKLNQFTDTENRVTENDELNPYFEEINSLQENFLELLNKNEFISNVDFIGERDEEHEEYFYNYLKSDDLYLKCFPVPVRFEVSLPFDQRSFPERVYWNSDRVLDEFSVFYNGKIFLAYAKIKDDLYESFVFEAEAREFLKKIFISTKWTSQIIYPCPLSFNFYFISEKTKKSIIKEYELDIELVHPFYFNAEHELNTFIFDLFIQESYAVEYFYSIMTISQKIDSIIKEFENLYCQIKELFFKLNIKRFKKNFMINEKSKLNSKIFELYSLLYDYEKHTFLYNDRRNDFAEKFKAVEISKYLMDYCLLQMKDKKDYPQANIIKSIEYMQSKINSNTTNFYVLISVLIGTILGFLLSFFK